MTDPWSQWEREVINGTFPLRSLLGSSARSAVFLTEYPAQGLTDAAIKIIAADVEPRHSQLVQWEAAMDLPHPHLLPLFECGLCQRAGRNFEFVVMEYANETLAEILPMRALTPEEVQAMLHPTLQALGFLHGHNFVHGGLKPTNFLVVGDQLKLASDTIRAAGESIVATTQPSPYDPPEGTGGRFPMAADMWALGVTMVEALTQRAPVWSESATVIPSLPDDTPSLLSKAVRRCLHRSPAARPSVADLDALLRGVAQSALASASESAAAPSESDAAEPQSVPPPPASSAGVDTPAAASAAAAAPAATAATAASAASAKSEASTAPLTPTPFTPPARVAAAPTARPAASGASVGSSKRPLLLVVMLLVAAIIVWELLHGARREHPPKSAATPAASAPTASAPDNSPSGVMPATPPSLMAPPVPKPVPHPSEAPNQAGNEASYVRHQELPVVSHTAMETIHGHFGVAVRVTLDTAGNVIDETLEQPGPSPYFARRSMTAAKLWRFVRADAPGTRTSLLWFEFSRDGATAHAEAPAALAATP